MSYLLVLVSTYAFSAYLNLNYDLKYITIVNFYSHLLRFEVFPIL